MRSVLDDIRYLEPDVENVEREMIARGEIQPRPMFSADACILWTLAMGFILGIVATVAFQAVAS